VTDKRKWVQQPWQPQPEFSALFHGKSGNVVNGVGEAEPRPPEHIFWLQNSSSGPFGDVQDAVVERHNAVPELDAVYANAQRGPRLTEPAAEKVARSAAEFTREISEFALAHEADQVGVAEIEPLWVFEGHELKLPRVIMLLVAMDHARSAHLPATAEHPDWAHEVAVQYNRGARAASHTAAYIRSLGYQAKPHAGPWVGSLNLIPAAIAAGLGELGKHGSMINRKFGSSFRLAAVETDLPLLADTPDLFGADDFCTRCQICTNACPPQAIATDKQMVRGIEKWYVDFDKCIGYFNETYGCAVCIAVCPWSKPGRAESMAEKYSRVFLDRDTE